ncbi:AraC family transcriptional regulator [Cohnella faecalis]|uniref:AraC family transcriptional regulator n=1 Tax=Cohnella faecalis TaxID=2315694 RepID=A0A398CWP9_9BACL|nr:AraC family transcriptional regulator [Cohnella faecalis]RIE03444.1 AraC family transcriptional regulator [Cohnella faecalis]
MAEYQYNPFRPAETPARLHLLFWGKEACSPGHAVGPGVRDVYKIHFVHDGKGKVRVGGQTYSLVAGQGFLIVPNVVYYYEADEAEPWTYSWIGFAGTDVAALLERTVITADRPVFTMDKKTMPALYEQLTLSSTASVARDLRLQAHFYEFLAAWIEISAKVSSAAALPGRQEEYVHRTLECLRSHYSDNISIEQIAESLGLDRKYLSAIFKKALDVPPMQYLLRYRMDKACELLGGGTLTVGEVARSVGYRDPLLFSRMFHKVKGVSPSVYRANATKTDINP